MKVILTTSVPKLGKVGDVVNVPPGFGRNYLLPRQLAVMADARNVARVEHEKRVINAQQRKVRGEAEELAKKLGGTAVSISVKVGEQDKLYGSVTSRDVYAALAAKGFGDLDKRAIQLDEPLREIGEFDVRIKLHADVVATVKVAVVADRA